MSNCEGENCSANDFGCTYLLETKNGTSVHGLLGICQLNHAYGRRSALS